MSLGRYLILMSLAATALLAAPGCGPENTGNMNRVFPQATRSGGFAPINYTIVLAQFPQVDGFGAAQQLKERAQILYGVADIWLENVQQWLSVNYGHFNEQAGPEIIQNELLRVRQLYAQLELGPYQFCYIKELPQPDPPAPASWYLLNNKCAYTLEVASYYNIPELGYYNRKADAVLAVKNLREKGESAYFIHGRFQSRVYLGCFPANAVQNTWQGNIQIRGLSPRLNELKQKYSYYENGGKIYDIITSRRGKETRIAREPVLKLVETLAQGMPF
jgi:hypothetical protein